MHILITGAAGFLGQRLIKALIARGELNGRTLTRMTLVDQVAPSVDHTTPPELAITTASRDLSAPDAWDTLLDERPDVIYHLAAVVSSAAEADLDLGMRVNFDTTRFLLEGCRARGLNQTRLIMASSVAVYGGQLPNVLDDMTALMPQSSYGTQKAMCELLINDYSRRGLVDGRVLRLPTIVIRPGRPNAAASSFASSILREPLNDEEAICPVPTDLELFVMSPARVVECLVHGAEVDAAELGACRALMLPGITVTVADMLDALQRKGGEEALSRVHHEPDEGVTAIVASWPGRFHTAKALRLGFRADDDFDAVVDAFISEQAG
ncbi:D-erythronate dehydrogenase [Halomonas binhaiensis]|uniref:NAD-dependent epimerase/dehydratase family protein n=1 Tax=Halomonas binhaiensis TaxID=2562282 RepID=A0A5C1NHI1_9GAMM|nr:D-erythronate dehydrogenase [Halomonas binhaiensis]QEM83132.1 NAD-dependent epimerase/dehydratase family protein [Halomonas binhaiensis]